ncbi:MAG: phosphatase PAP2 family protein [Sporolactobacillus sp.]
MMTRIQSAKIKSLFIIGSIALLFFTLESVTITQNIDRIGYFDFYIIQAFQSHLSSVMTVLMISATQLGSPAAIILLSILFVIVLLKHQMYGEGVWLLSTIILGAGIINPLMKLLIARPRPIFHRLIKETGYSYPSGHALGATIFYGSVALLAIFYLRRLYLQIMVVILAGVLIVLIMVSRIYLGVHYPSDVLAGGLLGISIDSLSAGIFMINRDRLRQFFSRYSFNNKARQQPQYPNDRHI